MASDYYYLLFAGLIAIFTARKINEYIQKSRFIKAHGCKPAKKLPQRERFIGYDLFKSQTKAVKEKRLLESNLERYREMGTTWTAVVMGNQFVSTMDPENIKAILATNFKDFGLGARLKSFGDLLGRGIFTSDGAHWEHSRALVRPSFTRTQVADLDTFETHIQQLILKIPRDGSTVELQSLFFQLTLDSATEFLFGESVNCLTSPEESEQQKFGKAFDFAQSQMSNKNRLGKLSFLYPDKQFTQACKTVHAFVDKIVAEALDRIKPQDDKKMAEWDSEPKRYVFLDEMVKATRDPKQLRDELLNILLAGRDTTASLLSHTFHILARRPDVWAKLKAEVEELDGKMPDYETLRNMKYMKLVLTESLRLWPVVPGNARFANKATTIPRGGGPDGQSPIYIPKGGIVTYSVYSMQRREDIYGPDANEFRPERWAPEEGLRPGWGYLPFNGGPRICVGQQFALTEASYTIVRLMQEFGEIQPRDNSLWTEQLSLTMANAGVSVAMVPR